MEKTFKERMVALEGSEKQAMIVRISKACKVHFGTVCRWVYSSDYPKMANRETIARILCSTHAELFPKK